jgi:hypothetical protein
MDRVLVCGDTHGQLQDVMVIFEELGLPAPGNVYLFNGNIADRGHNATEVRAEAERALVVAKGGPFDAAAAAATATAATDSVPALVAKASNTNTASTPTTPRHDRRFFSCCSRSSLRAPPSSTLTAATTSR